VKAASELVSALTPVRELDYARHPIKLVVSSPEIRRRLGSVEKEPFTVEWIESTLGPGDVLYDIGANVGPYSLIAAKATGARVFAFEPAPASFRDLAHNVELNDCVESVTPVPLALWSETGLLPVRWKSGKAGAARHRFGRRKGVGEGPVTLGIRLDDAVDRLGIPPPTHAKIDVDGHEVEVLRGAEQTLIRPEWRSILIELDRRETDRNREIRELLVAAGFDEGVRQERTASRRYPDPKRRPDVYWIFTRAAAA
jgi:FkbM family methyltransferase